MHRRWFRILTSLLLSIAAMAWGVDLAWAQKAPSKTLAERKGFSPAEIKAAAQRAAKLGLKPGVAGAAAQAQIPGGAVVGAAAAPLPGTEGPGGIPHYFGPYGNWAYSPLPKGPVGCGHSRGRRHRVYDPTVTITDAYGTASTTAATVTATILSPTAPLPASPGLTGGANYTAPVVTITDPTGTGALADAVIGGTLTGGMLKFVDKLPGLALAGANNLGQYIPLAVAEPRHV